MNITVDKIIRKKYTSCVFISPHLDDAALSAGSLMTDLSRSRINCIVINVFTGVPHIRTSLSVKQNLTQSGFSSMKSLYRARIDEDNIALKRIGVDIVNFGFAEALLRQKPAHFLSRIIPECSYVYPTYRYHIVRGRISPYDTDLIQNIAEKILPMIPNTSAVFCPYGLGGHVDHRIVRLAVEVLTKPVYWLDQPYLHRAGNNIPTTMPDGYTCMNYRVNRVKKNTLVAAYKTQVPALFPTLKVPDLDEYYLLRN